MTSPTRTFYITVLLQPGQRALNLYHGWLYEDAAWSRDNHPLQNGQRIDLFRIVGDSKPEVIGSRSLQFAGYEPIHFLPPLSGKWDAQSKGAA